MSLRLSPGRKLFLVCNYVFLISAAVLCLLPIVNVFAISLSASTASAAGLVKLWPVDFTLSSYIYVMERSEFITAFRISVERVILGVSVNMVLTILIAYPLSKESDRFRWRNMFVWFFVFTMLFNGGLIPWYMMIRSTGLLDSIWALILPGAVPIFNVVLMLNFFRQLPKEMEEAAFMDGAGHWTTLWKIYLPLSKPVLATLTLFCIVFHWNQWFDGLILMNSPGNYPLQSYLQTVIVNFDMNLLSMVQSQDQFKLLSEISNQSTKAAQIFFAALPVLAVYPFLQRYFMTGIVLGSVKG